MKERNIVAEIVIRATKLSERLTDPVRLGYGAGDGGAREFVVGTWKFITKKHTPVYYSSTHRRGEMISVQVYSLDSTDDHYLIFNFDKENAPYQNSDGKPWMMVSHACENELLPDLRRLMVLDDLAECG